MRQNTRSVLLEILGEGEELSETQIKTRLKEKGTEVTYDTIMRHLGQLVKDRVIKVRAFGEDYKYGDGKRHWTNHYSMVK